MFGLCKYYDNKQWTLELFWRFLSYTRVQHILFQFCPGSLELKFPISFQFLCQLCNNASLFFLTTCRFSKCCFDCTAVSLARVKGIDAVSSEIKVCIHRTTWKLTVHVGLLFSLNLDSVFCSRNAVPLPLALSCNSGGWQWWCRYWFRSIQTAPKTTFQEDQQHLVRW